VGKIVYRQTNNKYLKTVFENDNIIKLIKLYQESQIEHKRNNRLTAEIGSAREKDLVAYMKYILNDNIDYNINNEHEEDVILDTTKISIKHSSAKTLSSASIKVLWTENKEKQKKFLNDFKFRCDILIIYVRFDESAAGNGEIEILYNTQTTMNKIMESFKDKGVDVFKTRENSNGRGIEFSTIFFKSMVNECDYHLKLKFNDLISTTKYGCIERRINRCNER